MDEKSQQTLDNILKKNPDALTLDECGFLRARRTYLKDSQLEEYKSVIEVKPVVAGGLNGYRDLLDKAKALGYTGKRLKVSELETYIKEHTI